MKFWIYCCGCLMAFVLLAGCSATLEGVGSKQSPMIGTWKGTDAFGQTMEMTLKKNGDFELKVSGKSQSFTKSGSYTIDESQSPAHFNIVLDDREINTICKIDGDSTFIFESIGSGSRPTKFGSQQIVMERQ